MRLSHAEIIAVGSELLDGAHPDSNSLHLSRWLGDLGIAVRAKHVVADAREAIAAALRTSLARSPLVFCTGGLGPTWDDCTREAAATALGRRLRPDPAMVAHIRRRYKGRAMPAVNLRQADRLAGAQWLNNHHGSAPGQWCAAGNGRFLVLLPGPTHEMEAMFHQAVLPRLRRLAPAPAATRLLRVAGMGESAVDERIEDLCRTVPGLQVTILANSEPAVELHVRGERKAADQLVRQLRARLGNAIFARRPLPLAKIVGEALRARGHTVAAAESCTGGMVGAQLSAIPGSSRYFLGGVIAYSNDVKRQWLGVPAALLRRHGAVSAACAAAMANGVRQKMGADWGIAVTGIAGPGGGSAAKPVGTVYIGLSRAGHPAETHALRLTGDRDVVRRWSAHHALNDLRLRLLGGRD